MSKTYHVELYETLRYIIEVKADSPEEARQAVRDTDVDAGRLIEEPCGKIGKFHVGKLRLKPVPPPPRPKTRRRGGDGFYSPELWDVCFGLHI